MRTRKVVASVAAVMMAGAIGGSSPLAKSSPPSIVGVWLKEWRVVLSKKVVPAGKATFAVSNIGTLEHELVIIRTNRPPNALPVKGRKADEAGSRGEVEELRPPLADHLTLTLAPGRYVLICNLGDHSGHYAHGMFASLIVR